MESAELMAFSADKKEKSNEIGKIFKGKKEKNTGRLKLANAANENLSNRKGLQLAEKIESGQATEQELKDFLDICKESRIKPSEIAKIVEIENGQVAELSRFSKTDSTQGRFMTTKETKEEDRRSAIWDKTFQSGERIASLMPLAELERFAELVEIHFGEGEFHLRKCIEEIAKADGSSAFAGLLGSGILSDSNCKLASNERIFEWIFEHENSIKGIETGKESAKAKAA